MRQLAFMVGMFGAGLALVGALVAAFAGSVGLVTGGGLDAGSQVLRGFVGAAAAMAGGSAAVVVLFWPRAAAVMFAGSVIVGLAAVQAYFVIGGVLLALGAYYSFRAGAAPVQ